MNAFRRVVSVAFAFWLIVCGSRSLFGQGSRQISEYDSISEADREHPAARDAWFLRGRKAPNSESAAALRYRAHQQKLRLRRWTAALSGVMPNTSGSASWTSLGPAPMVSAVYSGSTQDYGLVSGRATAVAIDPADATGNTVFIGGAHGGVWKSNQRYELNGARHADASHLDVAG